MIDTTIEIRSINKAALTEAVFSLFIRLQKDKVKDHDMLSNDIYDINFYSKEVA